VDDEQVRRRRRVATASVGRLATVTADGRPHAVPCCFALDPDRDVVYSAVDGKPKSTRRLRRLANIRANPATTLLVDHYAADWSQLWWVRLDGTGRVVERPEEERHAIELLVAKYGQYRRDPPAGPVLAVDVTAWVSWP
jgi:PPOX class probable F420-dependent enzyme